MPAASALNLGSSNATVSLWLRTSAPAQYEHLLFEHSQWATAGTYQLSSFDARTLRWNFVGATAAIDGSRSFADGQWHYITGTFNDKNNSQQIFIDGALAGSGYNGGSIGSGVTPSFIGSRGGSTMFFSGQIDEVRISATNRPFVWTKLEYENQKKAQTLVSFGEKTGDALSSWPFSADLVLNTAAAGANVSATVTNIPLVVKLNPSNFSGFPRTLPGGDDVRFAKATGEQLPYQIQRWVDRAGNADSAEIWVLADTVYSNNASQYIRMYWGKTGVSSRSDGSTVFRASDGFMGVWHLEEPTPAVGTAAIYKDATENANNGTNFIANADQSGIIGNGHLLDGVRDFITIPGSASMNLNESSAMVSLWVKSSTPYAYERLLFEHDRWGTAGCYQVTTFGGTQLRWNFVGAQAALDYNRTINDGLWHLVAAVFDDSLNSQKLYYDGIPRVSAGNTASLGSSYGPSYIGCRGGYTMFFPGYVDEVRILRKARPAAWMKLEYENQRPDQKLISIRMSVPGSCSSGNVFTDQTPAGFYSDSRYELATRFKSTCNGSIDKVRIYTNATEGGAHTVRIWQVSNATVISGPHTWTIAAGPAGWKEFALPSAVPVSANVDYIVSVSNSTDMIYAGTNDAFNSPITNGSLVTYTGSGVYSTSLGTMPTTVYRNSNYFRDVHFVAQ